VWQGLPFFEQAHFMMGDNVLAAAAEVGNGSQRGVNLQQLLHDRLSPVSDAHYALQAFDGSPAQLDRLEHLLREGYSIPIGIQPQAHAEVILFATRLGTPPQRHFMVLDTAYGLATWVSDEELKSGAYASRLKVGESTQVDTIYLPQPSHRMSR
jgi:hypothetical protein